MDGVVSLNLNRNSKPYTQNPYVSVYDMLTWPICVAFQARGVAVDGIVSLDLPGKDDVLLLGRDLEGLVVPLSAKQARQDFDKAGVGAHEVVVDQTCSMHAHLQQKSRVWG